MRRAILFMMLILAGCSIPLGERDAEVQRIDVSDLPTLVIAGESFEVTIEAVGATEIESEVTVSDKAITVREELGSSFLILSVDVSPSAEAGVYQIAITLRVNGEEEEVLLGFEVVNETDEP